MEHEPPSVTDDRAAETRACVAVLRATLELPLDDPERVSRTHAARILVRDDKKRRKVRRRARTREDYLAKKARAEQTIVPYVPTGRAGAATQRRQGALGEALTYLVVVVALAIVAGVFYVMR